MDIELLLAITLIILGVERFAPGIPGWVLGIFALVTGILMLVL